MKLLVIGAGGHAKVVIDAARAAGFDVVGAVGRENDPADVLGIPVVAGAEGTGAEAFIVGIGDNHTRAELFDTWLDAGLKPVAVVHPSAIIAEGVTIESGAFVAPGVIVNVGSHIGENAILNTGCSIDHDVVVGTHAHIGPRVALCGGVMVDEGALVGVGSCAVPLAHVGAWSIVGAGAAVTGDVPEGATWGGVPARALHGRRAQSPHEDR